jgi:hypothetical protein
MTIAQADLSQRKDAALQRRRAFRNAGLGWFRRISVRQDQPKKRVTERGAGAIPASDDAWFQAF